MMAGFPGSKSRRAVSETTPPQSGVRCRPYGRFVEWLAGRNASVAATTYNSGRLIVLAAAGGRLRWRAWKFERPMGIAFSSGRLALATRGSVHRFVRREASGRHVLKHIGEATTGRVDAHEVAIVGGRVLLANTRGNCLARVGRERGLQTLWRPEFVDAALRRDQCHLNGLGVRDGRVAAVTLFARSSEPKGWRSDARFSSGELIEVPSAEAIAQGLCMPHSPRWDGRAWWVCDSGRGTLCRVGSPGGRCEPVVTLPGFTRGLSIEDGYALVGRSRFRDQHVLDTARIVGRDQTPRSGFSLVELSTGEEIGGVDFLAGGREVFEVLLLPGMPRPSLVMPSA